MTLGHSGKEVIYFTSRLTKMKAAGQHPDILVKQLEVDVTEVKKNICEHTNICPAHFNLTIYKQSPFTHSRACY